MCGDILHVNWTVMKRSDFCGISISRKKMLRDYFSEEITYQNRSLQKGNWEYFAAGNGSFSGGDWNVVVF